ncbi:hypothetical protein ACFQ5N_06840 [Lutibacter holmesii]|uniref:Uncharacterized protein n=1 Tax=Lutibacter holmesii TaxID=1137985 RepID=A0ABW3WMI3_9FLAO
MLRTFSTFCLFILISTTLFAQKSIKDYKYVIVPNQYEFQKSEDQYQVNSLVKFLFEKEDYGVYFSDDSLPKDLATNPCLALKVMVNDISGFLSTKVTISLVDCHNTVLYTTPFGRSKIKDFERGYHDAIRKAYAAMKEQEAEKEALAAELSETDTSDVPVKEAVAVEAINEEIASAPVEPAVEKEAVETKSEIDAAAKTVNSTAVVAVAAVPVVVPKQEATIEPEKEEKSFTIEGTYFIDMWGKCVISKKGSDYKVVGGDEDFEFAEIYTTSKPNIFMVKKTGFKQTQLLELDENGNLKIDSKSGVKIYKRVN